MTDKSARLTIDGAEIELPVLSPTEGPDVIDIGKLTAQGYFTYDPGFVSTASCDSSITYIDGDNGILLHRGYPIEQLAEKSDFLELCYLLLNDALPSASEKAAFVNTMKEEASLDARYHDMYKALDQNAHPMGIMCALVGAMSGHYHAGLDITVAADRDVTCNRLIAKMPTLAAMTYRHGKGLPFVAPRADLGYAENFLNMMFSDGDNYEVNPVLAKAMDRIFLLHADHEQNASTSTVRLSGSTGANPYACISAGIAALWGPSHGGANEAVLNMLAEIGDPSNIGNYVKKAKDKDDPFRVMGFGHRVYKNFDPRAKVMQQTCHEVLGELGVDNDPTLQMAQELERIALEDDFFVDRRIYPKVDIYSRIILKAIGIPTDMFTVIFTTGRTPGWIAHWKEMVSVNYKIGRPRQLYTGSSSRDYITND
ncbi:MAG: citrate synthase [Pseudomonadales bacterium]|nr:citrate synthase [Pseudomonadales bacterium]